MGTFMGIFIDFNAALASVRLGLDVAVDTRSSAILMCSQIHDRRTARPLSWTQTIRAPIMHGHRQFELPSCMDTNNSSSRHAWTQTIRAAIMHSMEYIAIPACGCIVDTKSSSPKHAWHGMHRHIHIRDTHMHLQVSGVIDTRANCACRRK